MHSHDLWRTLGQGETNLDPAARWFYALRYSEEDLREHQESVIACLQQMGGIIGLSSDNRVQPIPETELDNNDQNRFDILVEELGITNDALRFSKHKIHLYGMNIVQLADTFKQNFGIALSRGDKEGAIKLMYQIIPSFVSDISASLIDIELMSVEQTGQTTTAPITEAEQKALVELGSFAADKIALLHRGESIFYFREGKYPEKMTAVDLQKYES